MHQNNTGNSRRNFLRSSLWGTALALAAPTKILKAAEGSARKRILLKQDAVILFQGDSITDAGRNKTSKEVNNNAALGNGYACMAAANLLVQHPGKKLQFFNRGISGNKVHQLAARWQEDCLAIKPDVLSIMIGVNDFWHTLTSGYPGTLDTYTTDFRKLLTDTRQALPHVQLIIGEPFAVKGIRAVDEKWYPHFDGYRAAAKSIAAEFEAVFVPYQKVFDEAQKRAPGVYWTYDGVHPTVAGARLMADAWLQAVK